MMTTRSRMSLKPRRLLFCLLASTGLTAAAQETAEAPPEEGAQAEIFAGPDIIVIGIPEFLRDIVPERSLDEEDIAGYGVGTVEELIGELGGELGDDEDPVLIVNGQRVDDPDEIAGLPVEAVQRIDVLPRGSGTRVGASANRRVYSLVLRRQVRQATVSVAPRFATDGDWGAIRAGVILTRIRGQERLNLSFSVRDEDRLLESERGIIQPTPFFPFDLRGNVIADPRGGDEEIDPALSALAGTLVTVAAVPPGASPALADFLAGANMAAITDLGPFRTLRPKTREYEVGLTGATRLAPWLTVNGNARLSHADRESLLGLPSAVFILPATSDFSPFSRDVGVARYGDPLALQQAFRTIRGNANLRFNANFGAWRVTLGGSHQQSDSRTLTNRQDLLQAGRLILLDDDRNPFDGSLADLLPIVTDRSTSKTSSSNLQLTATGSPLRIPAGPIQVTAEARLHWSELEARSAFLGNVTERSRSRSEKSVRGSLEIPLASRRNDFLPALGELAATLEYAVVDYSRIGSLDQYGYGLTWSPQEWLRVRGSVNHVRRPPNLQLLVDPVIVTPGVRTFDFVRGETVDVAWISGGNPDLRPENIREERVSLILRPLQAVNLQFSADYTGTRNRDFVAALPPASLAILLAFPDRFVRDETGRLATVDIRPVNFDVYEEDRLRYGVNLTLPIGRTAPPRRPTADGGADGDSEEGGEEGAAAPSFGRAPGNRTRLQLSANHTIVLDNDIVIRPGLAPVDLLEGGAIGIAGGRNRHQIDFALGLNSRGLGARLTGIWRGSSLLETRIGGTADRLRFSSYGTLNLRAFAEARRLFPQTRWLHGTRFSINVVNLTNERQRIVDSTGETPLQYQSGYRDPLGRTVEFEIRRVF